MTDQTLVNQIRSETYLLEIFAAFNYDKAIIIKTKQLIKFVHDVFRYLEPSHFKGELVVCIMLNNELLANEADAETIYDFNILISKGSERILISQTTDDNILLWENLSLSTIYEQKNNALFYYYSNNSECFYANCKKISVTNRFSCPSIFALQYHYLKEALDRYKIEQVMASTCPIFSECWFDEKHILFKNKPEKYMQKSLETHLKSLLRGVTVVREYTLGASKPVDVRVHWNEANRAAIIEIKWLGVSVHLTGNSLSTCYDNRRANEGMDQLKEYNDLVVRDTPSCITKSYLVVIDGRRDGIPKRINPNTESIALNVEQGHKYQSEELTIDNDKKYFESHNNYEIPIRMFVRPICS